MKRAGRKAFETALALLVTFALMLMCAEALWRIFDEWFDELCRRGWRTGPELCPPERFEAGELPERPKYFPAIDDQEDADHSMHYIQGGNAMRKQVIHVITATAGTGDFQVVLTEESGAELRQRVLSLVVISEQSVCSIEHEAEGDESRV